MADWSGYLNLILQGALVTAQLTVYGSILALAAAFLAGLGRLSQWRAIRWLSTVYIEFFRGTSIYVQLFWAYFVLPFMGISLSPLAAGIMALGLNVGAYAAEVVRGAILSVPRDQYEATTALNLTRFQRMRHVILPQALPLMLPTFGNNAIELLKATAVVSLISRAHRVTEPPAFGVLMLCPALWVVIFAVSSIVGVHPSGWVSSIAYGLMSMWVWIAAGWDNHAPRGRVVRGE